MGEVGVDEGQALVAALAVLATPSGLHTETGARRARNEAMAALYATSRGFRSRDSAHEDAAQELFLRWHRTGVRLEQRSPAQAKALLMLALENMLREKQRRDRLARADRLDNGDDPEAGDRLLQQASAPTSAPVAEELAAYEALRDAAVERLRNEVLPRCLEGKRSYLAESEQVFEARVAIALGEATQASLARAHLEAQGQGAPGPEDVARRVGTQQRAQSRLLERLHAWVLAHDEPDTAHLINGLEFLRRRRSARDDEGPEPDRPTVARHHGDRPT